MEFLPSDWEVGLTLAFAGIFGVKQRVEDFSFSLSFKYKLTNELSNKTQSLEKLNLNSCVSIARHGT